MVAADARSVRSRSTATALAFVGAGAVLLVIWRWRMLAAHGAPVGVDTGHWLAFGDRLFGGAERGTDATYPPLVPMLSRGFAALLGMPAAAHGLAAFAAAAPGLGVWVAARKALGDPISATAGLVVAVGAATSAAAAWGGIPQLLGVGLAPVTLVALTRTVHQPTGRHAVVAGLLLLVVGATSPLVFGLVLAAGLLSVIVAVTVAPSTAWIRWLPVLAAPLVIIAPLYAPFVNASVDVGVDGRGELALTFGAAVVAWVLLLALAVTAPFLTTEHRREPLWAASTGMTVAALGSLLANDNRATALVPSATVLGTAVLVAWAPRRGRTVSACLAAVASVAILVAAPTAMSEQRDRYAALVPRHTGSVVAWMSSHVGRAELVSVAPVKGVPFGWVIEGWGRQAVLVGSDPRWLRFADERADARVVRDIFTAARWPGERALRIARAHGVKWLYVPSTWGGVDVRALHALERQHPGLVRYRGPGGLVVAVPGNHSRSGS